jgi:hypothetical protein
MPQLAHHSTTGLAVLLLLVAVCARGASCFTCPDILEKTCEDCNEDNKCIKCRDQYYLEQGQCLECVEPCLNCYSRELCASCANGFQLSGFKCKECGKNCEVCDPKAENKCQVCQAGFRLDSEQTCFNRFAHLLFLGGLVGVTAFIFFVAWLARKCAKRSQRREPAPVYVSMLDDELKRKPFQMALYLEDIGRSTDPEQPRDMSTVGKPTKSYFTSRNTLVQQESEEIKLSLLEQLKPAPVSPKYAKPRPIKEKKVPMK